MYIYYLCYFLFLNIHRFSIHASHQLLNIELIFTLLGDTYTDSIFLQLVDLMFKDSMFTLLDDSYLSHDIASGSKIMPCNKMDKPLAFYRFRNVT